MRAMMPTSSLHALTSADFMSAAATGADDCDGSHSSTQSGQGTARSLHQLLQWDRFLAPKAVGGKCKGTYGQHVSDDHEVYEDTMRAIQPTDKLAVLQRSAGGETTLSGVGPSSSRPTEAELNFISNTSCRNWMDVMADPAHSREAQVVNIWQHVALHKRLPKRQDKRAGRHSSDVAIAITADSRHIATTLTPGTVQVRRATSKHKTKSAPTCVPQWEGMLPAELLPNVDLYPPTPARYGTCAVVMGSLPGSERANFDGFDAFLAAEDAAFPETSRSSQARQLLRVLGPQLSSQLLSGAEVRSSLQPLAPTSLPASVQQTDFLLDLRAESGTDDVAAAMKRLAPQLRPLLLDPMLKRYHDAVWNAAGLQQRKQSPQCFSARVAAVLVASLMCSSTHVFGIGITRGGNCRAVFEPQGAPNALTEDDCLMLTSLADAGVICIKK